METTKKHVLLFAIFIGSLQGVMMQAGSSQVTLDYDCFMRRPEGFLLGGEGTCGCRKSDAQQAGTVRWFLSDGTVAQQDENVEGGSSVLFIKSPGKYVKEQTYVCRVVSASEQQDSGFTYTVRFPYGPESVKMKIADYDAPYCSVVNKTTRVWCEVPADTVYPEPKFNYAQNNWRGELIEGANVWRLDRPFTPISAGLHHPYCFGMNMHYGPQLLTNITVRTYAQPQALTLLIQGQNFHGTADNHITLKQNEEVEVACQVPPYEGFTVSKKEVKCGDLLSDKFTATSNLNGQTCSCSVQYENGCTVNSISQVLLEVV